MILIAWILAGLGLLIASITDLKTREVPDLVNYGLRYAGFGIGIIYSIVSHSWAPIIESVAGFAAGYLLGLAMFYTGQWGGGDSKMIMGIGALLGLSIFNLDNLFFLTFLINTIVIGAVYGLAWSFYLGIRHRKIFVKALDKLAHEPKILAGRKVMIVFAILGIIGAFLVNSQYRIWVFGFVAVIYIFFYLWLMIKVIEKNILITSVDPKVLTEGDWIAKDIYVNKKYIAGPKDLGVSKEQIALLMRLKKQKKIKTVLMKQGIPFVPSFLIAFIVTLWLGNWLFMLLL